MSPHMRTILFRSSFQFKLLFIFTLLTGLCSVSVTSLHIVFEIAEYRRNISEKLQLESHHLAETIRLPLYAENRATLQQFAEKALHIPEVRAVMISNGAGKVLAVAQLPVIDTKTETIKVEADIHGTGMASSPDSAISGGSDPTAALIGKVRLERGTDDLSRRIHRLVLVSSGIALAFWLTVSLLCHLALRKVTRSFKTLMHGIATMQGGDMSSRIEVVSDDEPGIAANAFNELAVSLHRRDEENQQLHQELRDREQHLKLLLEITERDTRIRLSMASANAFLFAWDIDLTTKIISYSDGVEHVFDTEILKDDFYDLKKLASRIHEKDLVRLRSFDSGAVSLDEQFRIKVIDESYIWVEIHGKIIYEDQGKPVRVVGIGQNITERKQLEVAQRRVNALAQDLALAEERERYRIAEELHDEVGPNLLFCLIKLESLRSMSPDQAYYDQIEPIEDIISLSIEELRSLTFQLRPPILSTAGFMPALKWLVNEFHDKYGIEVSIAATTTEHQMDIECRSTLFQVVRETLVNIIKHAGTKQAAISIEKSAGKIIVTVQDHGIGFDPAVKLIPKSDTQGFGMFNIGQKIEHIGGSIVFDSRPGAGTLVTITVPERITAGNTGDTV